MANIRSIFSSLFIRTAFGRQNLLLTQHLFSKGKKIYQKTNSAESLLFKEVILFVSIAHWAIHETNFTKVDFHRQAIELLFHHFIRSNYSFLMCTSHFNCILYIFVPLFMTTLLWTITTTTTTTMTMTQRLAYILCTHTHTKWKRNKKKSPVHTYIRCIYIKWTLASTQHDESPQLADVSLFCWCA